MRAIIVTDYGDSKQMRVQTLDRPDVRAGCVLIRVIASSVNPIDIKLRTMGATMPVASRPPYVPGIDCVGDVVQCGDGVTDFQVGDRVFGCPGGLTDRQGTLADYVVADARTIAHAPKNLSPAECTALPLVSITAWEAIFERITLTRDDSLLIYGGTGGVGHIAVQLAKATGARIVTTASSDEKAQLAQSLGANDVFNAREVSVQAIKDTYADGEGFDYVFDTVGGAHLGEAFDVAKPGGEIVTIAARASVDLSLMHAKGLSLHVVFMLSPFAHGTDFERYNHILNDITRRVENATLRPLVDTKTFALEDAATAYDYLDSGEATGKVVILHDV